MKRNEVKQILIFFLVIVLCISPISAIKVGATEQNSVSDSTEITGSSSMGKMIANEVSQAEQTPTLGNYDISELEISGNIAQVQFKTEKTATLVVALYEDLKCIHMLASGKTTVNAGANNADVTIETKSMPEYFVAKAYLLEKDSLKPLCNSYTSQMYTKSMQELEKSTADDYEGREVLKLDENDNSTNFGVFKEDTIVLEEGIYKDQVTDYGDGTYTITNADAELKNLKEGDTFSYQQKNGEVLLVKVKGISVRGNIVYVTEDKDTDLTDYFDYFKLEVDNNNLDDVIVDDSNLSDGITVENGDNETFIDGTEEDEILSSAKCGINLDSSLAVSKNIKIKDDTCKIDCEMNFGINVAIKIYILPEYRYASLKTGISFTFISGKSINGDILKIPLGIEKLSYLGIITVEVSPALVGKVSGKIDGHFKIYKEWEMEYDSDLGCKTSANDWVVEYKLQEVSGSFFIGLEAPIKAYVFCKNEIMIGTKIYAGMEAEVESDAIINPNVIHDCITCFKGVIYKKISAEGLQFTVFKNAYIDTEALNITWKQKVSDFYWSVGHKEFGLGTCPYINYLIKVDVTDTKKNPVAGSKITVTNKKTWKTVKFYTANTGTVEQHDMTDKNGVAEIYLPNGSYIIRAEKQRVTNQKEITVLNGKGMVKLTLQTPTTMPTPTPKLTPKPTSVPTEIIGSGIDSGISWKLKKDGTFYVYVNGNGKMSNYGYMYNPGTYSYVTVPTPWEKLKDKIKNVILEEGVLNVGNDSFSECSNLKNVTLPSTIKVIGSNAFDQCINLEKIELPKGLLKIKEGAFGNCNKMQDIKLPDGLQELEESTFIRCEGIKKITIPQNITSIDFQTFAGCKNLKEIVFPSNLSYIGEFAFSDCSSLENVEFPDTFNGTGKFAFSNCSNLKNIIFTPCLDSNGYLIEHINLGKGSFSGCSSLESITLTGVSSLSTGIFSYCKNLKTIYFTGEKPQIDSGSLWGINVTIYYPSGNETWNGIESETFEGTNIQWVPYTSSFQKQTVKETTSPEELYTPDFADAADKEIPEKLEEPVSETESENSTEQSDNQEDFGQLEEVDPDSETGESITEENIETLEPPVVNTQQKEIVISTVKTYSKRKPGSYTLFVLVKDKNAVDILASNNLLYIDQVTADKTGVVSFTYQLNKAVTNPVSCVYGDYIHQHKYGAWKTIKKATIFAPEIRQRKCSGCSKIEKKNFGHKLKPILNVSASTVTLKAKQSTRGLKITKMETGDAVAYWKSSNTKIVKVSKNGQLFAQKKTGKTTVTVKLKSGISKKIVVKVQNRPVRTTKLTGLKKQISIKKGQKLVLKPVRSPFTSVEKIMYSSSNKKIVSVTSKGEIKGVKRGKAKITVKSGNKKYVVNVVVK